VLITSSKKNWTLKPIISVGMGLVVPSSFYYIKWIWLNRCWHNTYVTCKHHPIKIPDQNLFVHSFTRPYFLGGSGATSGSVTLLITTVTYAAMTLVAG